MSHPHGEPSAPVTQPVAAPAPSALSEAAGTPAEHFAAAQAQPGSFAAAPAVEPTLVGVAAAPADQAAYQIGVAPVSAPAGAVPGYAPVSAVPGYGPVSAVPYGLPGYPMEAPKKRGRAGIIVLSVLTGLLALGAAGMSTLYFVEKSERTAADKLATQQAATIKTDESKIKDLEGKVAETKSEVAKLTQEVEGAKTKTADIAKEKEALANCFRAMDDYFRSQTKANQTALVTACDEAAKYY